MNYDNVKSILNESVVFRGSITLILLIGVTLMTLQEIEIPDWYISILMLAIGYFFGAPLPSQIARQIRTQQAQDWKARDGIHSD